jgi:hypothetical protein
MEELIRRICQKFKNQLNGSYLDINDLQQICRLKYLEITNNYNNNDEAYLYTSISREVIFQIKKTRNTRVEKRDNSYIDNNFDLEEIVENYSLNNDEKDTLYDIVFMTEQRDSANRKKMFARRKRLINKIKASINV